MSFTFLVGVCFTLNYVIGSGFLTLPWAFNAAGLGFATLILTLVSGISVMTCFQLLEVVARTNKLVDIHGLAGLKGCDLFISSSTPTTNVISYGSIPSEPENTIIELTNMDRKCIQNDNDNDDDLISLGERKFEVAELCGIYLGSFARKIYLVSISFYFYGAMWAYSTVFCNGWANWMPFPGLNTNESYYVYLTLWGIVECTWCLFELDEQIFVQVILAAGRVLMFLLMIGTVVISHFIQQNCFDLPKQHHDITNSVQLWTPSNLYIILPIAFYANIK